MEKSVSAKSIAPLQSAAMHVSSPEAGAIKNLHSALSPYGVSEFEAVAIWIGLKAKPGMIFQCAKPDQANRVAVTVASTVLGPYQSRFIRLHGHPSWAEPGKFQGSWIQMQSRLNSLRFSAFVNSAAAETEDSNLYFILLEGISRSELHNHYNPRSSTFHALGGVLDLPGMSVARLIENEQRFFLMATEGQPLGMVTDHGALRFNTFFTFDGNQPSPRWSERSWPAPKVSLQSTLVAFRSRDPYTARALIPPDHLNEALRPAGEVIALMEKHKIQPSQTIFRDAYLLIGHSWDAKRNGLFSNRSRLNIQMAGDFWLRQSFIPYIWNQAKQFPRLRDDILSVLSLNYPKAEALWRRLMDSAK